MVSSDGTNNFSSCLQWLAWLASGISEILIFFHQWIGLCSHHPEGILIIILRVIPGG